MSGIIEWAVGDFTSGVMGLFAQYGDSALAMGGAAVEGGVDTLHYHLLTVPFPESLPPEDPFWIAVFITYMTLAAFCLPLGWTAGLVNVAFPRHKSTRDRAKTLLILLVGIIGGLPFLALWNEFWSTAAIAFAPQGAELVGGPDGLAKLGVGVILGAVLAVAKPLILLAGLLIHAAVVIVALTATAAWPLSLTLSAADTVVTKTLGVVGLVAALAPGPLQFAKSVGLRFLFSIPFDPTEPGTAAGLILVIIGLLVIFVALPWKGLKYATPQAVTIAGGSPEALAGNIDATLKEARQRAPSRQVVTNRLAGSGRLSNPVAGVRSRLAQRGGGSQSGSGSRPPTHSLRRSHSRSRSRRPGQSGSGARSTKTSRSRHPWWNNSNSNSNNTRTRTRNRNRNP